MAQLSAEADYLKKIKFFVSFRGFQSQQVFHPWIIKAETTFQKFSWSSTKYSTHDFFAPPISSFF